VGVFSEHSVQEAQLWQRRRATLHMSLESLLSHWRSFEITHLSTV